ncbi:MAG: hypothetical protein FKY71_10000 [Spiribacter salinus]|uniref:Uncharacterized protein n=1 Tax=Spiribacter salinus TaxID=1335746 RepID=A0A540VQY5_9GAMM|nr:MAG: hypothetical protein FKY71_10000 [Spiribacter salinus]
MGISRGTIYKAKARMPSSSTAVGQKRRGSDHNRNRAAPS